MDKVLVIKFNTPENLERIRIAYKYPERFEYMNAEEIFSELRNNSYIISSSLNEKAFSLPDDPLQTGVDLITYLKTLSNSPLDVSTKGMSPRLLTIVADALWAFANMVQYPEIYSLPPDSIKELVFVDDQSLKISDGEVYVNGDKIGILEGW